jgi:hypothetical protein
MNMAKAVKIYTGFTMDFTADRQAAVREDGAVFTHVKGRCRYGYAWGAWRRADAVPAGFHEASAPDIALAPVFSASNGCAIILLTQQGLD